jgi:hypothetical protein
MNFEDLFVKQRPPKDYVSYPPQETPTLEKFFQERTAAPVAPVSPIVPAPAAPILPKMAEPISEEKKQIIKSQFNLNKQPQVQSELMTQPEMAQPEVTPEQPIMQFPDLATTSTEETRKPATELDGIPDQAEKMLPKRDWTDMLPYLAPLIVGALSGDTMGASSGIAGEQLLKGEGERVKRKQSLEDQLMAMQKAKLLKKNTAVKYQLKPLRNKATGESFIGSYDPSSNTMTLQDGTPVDTAQYELAPGLSTPEFQKRQIFTGEQKKVIGDYFGQGVKQDPETGLLSRVINNKMVPIQLSRNQLNPKQVKDLDATINTWKATDAYKKPAATFQTASSVDKLLAMTNNPASAAFARRELAKMAEGGGKLSDQDVASVGGSNSYRADIKRFANLQKTDMPLTVPEIAALKEIARVLREDAQLKLRNSVGGLEQSFIQKGGIPGAIQTAVSPLIPGLFTPKTNATKATFAGMVLMKNRDGVKGYVPAANVQKALNNEYTRVE